VRRKPGALVPLEESICATAIALRRRGVREFHGYELAKALADEADRRLLTAYGTLYRALARLEAMGLLQSRREDPEIAARENRPGRRLYTLTGAGETAARQIEARARATRRRRRPSLARA
jgi:PadR family transcriptional regulator PadR